MSPMVVIGAALLIVAVVLAWALLPYLQAIFSGLQVAKTVLG